MPIFSIVFLCGDIFLQQFKMLPSLAWLIIPALALCIYLYKKYKIIYIFLIFLLGFSYSLLFSYERKASILPNNIEGKTIPIEGYIFSIPQTNEIQTQFHFTFYKMNHIKKHGMIQLSWRDQKNHLVAGNHWKLFVRLKRIHGMMNPGGSDYEAWALQEGIIAQGYVVNHVENSIINHSWVNAPVTHVRQLLKECIDEVLLKTPTSPWIYALALGERHDIPPEDWEVLRKTGTNHLMAIAGLHIGFMSGFIFAIVSFIWRRFYYLSIIIPAQYAGAIAALLMTLTYSALAGFSIPTQRACIMLLVFLIYLLLRRKIAAWSAWSAALFLVLLFNPLSVLSESFWLSFGSVALIIYGVSGRLHPTGLWWKWGRIQWVMALGLVPLSIALFGQCSLISFVANSLAIPWVGFIIVPLVLLGCFTLLFSMKLGGFFLFLADKNLTWMWSILSYFSHFSGSVWYQFIPHYWIIIMAITGVVILLLPIGFPGRWLGVIGLLPMLYYKPVPVHFSEVKLTLLDVGQGLSVVIQTQKHLLVFDAGAHLSNSYDMGSSVVIPFLRTLSNKKIDMLVISHGDNDHAGGAETILKQMFLKNLNMQNIAYKINHGIGMV
jgi:competence protein ComEC